MCVPQPGKHITLAKCVFPPWEHVFLVICVVLPGRRRANEIENEKNYSFSSSSSIIMLSYIWKVQLLPRLLPVDEELTSVLATWYLGHFLCCRGGEVYGAAFWYNS